MKENNAARLLFLQESFGVLSTISRDVPGYPFGSVTPYCADRRGRAIIYIAEIAQHTRNIVADSRVSLTVFDSSGDSDDVQARGRVTYIGDAREVDSGDLADTQERYFRYFPSSRQYEQTHGFHFFRIDPVRVRFIGGFGQIFWVEPQDFLTTNPFSVSQESRILQHMNNDHHEALMQYAGGKPAVMTGIDAEGFDVLTAGRKIRFTFETPISTMDEARQALVALAKRPA
jgi:putative heme iron utilization protein